MKRHNQPGCLGVGWWVTWIRGFLLFCALGSVRAGENDAIGNNNLGGVARSCAKKYCEPIGGGLDLWLSLEQKCFVTADFEYSELKSPVRANRNNTAPAGRQTTLAMRTIAGGDTRDMTIWSPIYAVFVCLFFASVGVYAGFRHGTKFGAARNRNDAYPVA